MLGHAIRGEFAAEAGGTYVRGVLVSRAAAIEDGINQAIGVYENLSNLDKLLGRKFFFVGAPLRLIGGSASPVRALALVF